MAKMFDKKIRELQERKSELNLSFLQNEKEKYQCRLNELLEIQVGECEEKNAYKEARECHAKIKEINHKIQHLPEDIENIDKKILFLQERKEIPLYRETREWIAEIFWQNIVKYAEENSNEELMNKLKTRTLTLEEYMEFLDKEYSEFLDVNYNEDLVKEHEKTENMYVKLFTPRLNKLDKLDKKSSKNKNNNVQQTPKISIKLPEWMSDQIYEELRNNKDIHPQDMIKFLKNELKKNAWKIPVSHIRNIFKDNYNQAYEYIKRLIINYQWFKLEDNVEDNLSEKNGKPTPSILDVSSEESEKYKKERLRQNSLSDKLNEIKKIENLKTRISRYLDLFEELDNVSVDRKDFEPKVYEVITRHTHIEIEKDIIKTLNQLIQWKPCMERIWLYKYNVYKFNRDSWRMLAYPNWELFTICPHEEYERIINTQPPANKTE